VILADVCMVFRAVHPAGRLLAAQRAMVVHVLGRLAMGAQYIICVVGTLL